MARHINFTAAMAAVKSDESYVPMHQKNILGSASLDVINDKSLLNDLYVNVLNNLKIEKRIPTDGMTEEQIAKCTEFMKKQADLYVTEFGLANVVFNNSVQGNRNVRQIPVFKSAYVNIKGQLITQHKAGSKANTAFSAVRNYLVQGENLNIARNLEIGENLIANFALVGTFRRGYDHTGKASLLVVGVISVTNTKTDERSKASATVSFVYGESTTENGKLEATTTFTKNISDIKAVSFKTGEDVAGQGYEDVLEELFDANKEIRTTIQSDKQIQGSMGGIHFFDTPVKDETATEAESEDSLDDQDEF